MQTPRPKDDRKSTQTNRNTHSTNDATILWLVEIKLEILSAVVAVFVGLDVVVALVDAGVAVVAGTQLQLLSMVQPMRTNQPKSVLALIGLGYDNDESASPRRRS